MESNANIHRKVSVRRRSSLFTSDAGSSSSVATTTSGSYKPSYEKQLIDEIASWSRLVNDKIHEINQHKKDIIELDVSLLSDEQRRYSSAGPKVDDYLQEANDFGKLVERYIQRKSFLARRYDAILNEARAHLDNKALDVVEKQLFSEKIE